MFNQRVAIGLAEDGYYKPYILPQLQDNRNYVCLLDYFKNIKENTILFSYICDTYVFLLENMELIVYGNNYNIKIEKNTYPRTIKVENIVITKISIDEVSKNIYVVDDKGDVWVICSSNPHNLSKLDFLNNVDNIQINNEIAIILCNGSLYKVNLKTNKILFLCDNVKNFNCVSEHEILILTNNDEVKIFKDQLSQNMCYADTIVRYYNYPDVLCIKDGAIVNITTQKILNIPNIYVEDAHISHNQILIKDNNHNLYIRSNNINHIGGNKVINKINGDLLIIKHNDKPKIKSSNSIFLN